MVIPGGGKTVSASSFIRAQVERLPARVTVIDKSGRICGQTTSLKGGIAERGIKKFRRLAFGTSPPSLSLPRDTDVALIQFGPTGVHFADVCEKQRISFAVHFHGYDATRQDVLRDYAIGYRKMFRQAGAIISVSQAMHQQLLSLGCPASKLHYNTYGVDLEHFSLTQPGRNPATFLSVGRMVDKKAHHLVILAFAEVCKHVPTATLKIIGDGPLRGSCLSLRNALRLQGHVELLGDLPHNEVAQHMRQARAYVQHSIVAADGDCEGTPVSIIEASGCGLPVIATRHAGIPDIVLDGVTGLLVDEFDLDSMTQHMIRLAQDPVLAQCLGMAGHQRVASHFTLQQSLSGLWAILEPLLPQNRVLKANGS